MEKQKRSKQSWWPLCGLGLILVGGLFWAHYVAPSPGWRIFLQIGVVVVGYGLIMVWLELHPDTLPEQPPAEADHPEGKSPYRVWREFHADSAPALIYGGPESSNGNLHPNGNYHLSRTVPAPPEEASDDSHSERIKVK